MAIFSTMRSIKTKSDITITASSSFRFRTSSSVETVANNDDLLTEILHRLPIKSLLKFNPVPQPIAGLFMRGLGSPEYYFINLGSSPSPAPFKSLTFGNNPSSDSGITIEQSCNGLLLCSCIKGSAGRPDYYVYNPTTHQYTMLPPPLVDSRNSGFNLAFDPSKSPHYEGSIYWINERLCFNIDEEKMQEMPLLPAVEGWGVRCFYYLGISRGHLHLIENYGPALFNVYEMENDCSGWFVKYRVDLRQVATTFPEMIRSQADPGGYNYYKISTICVVREENEDDSYLVVHLPGKCDFGEGRYITGIEFARFISYWGKFLHGDSFSTGMLICPFSHVYFLSLLNSVYFPNLLLRLNLFPKSFTFTGLFIRHLGRPEYYFINLSSSPSPAPFKSLTFENDSSDSGINIQQSCNGRLPFSSDPLKKIVEAHEKSSSAATVANTDDLLTELLLC
ncbi:hypothetical protein Patl1_20711 [Pistacia atlantica]|uniref:Uncharacterized protein n=1 Tax=Pistacia atlantica TaxID=434234 RepID=A0ACC1BLT0_9ROSI|nr:hypothetical protein Patl1_20711 [Pistacia atlantica]